MGSKKTTDETLPPTEPTRFVTLSEYARHVRKSRAWAYAHKTEIRTVVVHGALRVPREELDRLAVTP